MLFSLICIFPYMDDYLKRRAIAPQFPGTIRMQRNAKQKNIAFKAAPSHVLFLMSCKFNQIMQI